MNDIHTSQIMGELTPLECITLHNQLNVCHVKTENSSEKNVQQLFDEIERIALSEIQKFVNDAAEVEQPELQLEAEPQWTNVLSEVNVDTSTSNCQSGKEDDTELNWINDIINSLTTEELEKQIIAQLDECVTDDQIIYSDVPTLSNQSEQIILDVQYKRQEDDNNGAEYILNVYHKEVTDDAPNCQSRNNSAATPPTSSSLGPFDGSKTSDPATQDDASSIPDLVAKGSSPKTETRTPKLPSNEVLPVPKLDCLPGFVKLYPDHFKTFPTTNQTGVGEQQPSFSNLESSSQLQAASNTLPNSHKLKAGKKRARVNPVQTQKEKPFVCEVCQKRFRLEKHLKVHFVIHKDEKKIYQCPECDKKCCYLGALGLHMRTHTASRARQALAYPTPSPSSSSSESSQPVQETNQPNSSGLDHTEPTHIITMESILALNPSSPFIDAYNKVNTCT